MQPLSFYLFFHLNIGFSSVDIDTRETVLHTCYWPVLRLAEQPGIKLGIEAPAETLEIINEIDPSWIRKLRSLLHRDQVSFIGSGYSQIIGPLVPATVNKANLYIGNLEYQRLLGTSPRIGLVNEQAWSKGVVDNYLEAGYEALIMEWDNPAQSHPEWDRSWQYYPQRGMGTGEKTIKLIWNHSISFQKLQRYIHDEIGLDEYRSYLVQLSTRAAKPGGVYTFYGNDAEIFNFRPGRYHTESPEATDNEWDKVAQLIRHLQEDNYRFIPLESVLDHPGHALAWQALDLQSSEQPIPVKKQPKYNLSRWAVTGRDDTGLNTSCYRLLKKLQAPNLSSVNTTTSDLWKSLCSLWCSDLRTHITSTRFARAQRILTSILGDDATSMPPDSSAPPPLLPPQGAPQMPPEITEDDRTVTFSNPTMVVTFDKYKGLTIRQLIFKDISDKPIIGTIPHGYYDSIEYGADFFTGHMVYATPGHAQITDLMRTRPEIDHDEQRVTFTCRLGLPCGSLQKTVTVDGRSAKVTISYQLHFTARPYGSLRLGFVTLNPEFFDIRHLYFGTHNGGAEMEHFSISPLVPINHFQPVSQMVSISQCLGETEGIVELGDNSNTIRIFTPKDAGYSVGGIHFVPIGRTYLLRHIFSLLEYDDTNISMYSPGNVKNETMMHFTFSISAH